MIKEDYMITVTITEKDMSKQNRIELQYECKDCRFKKKCIKDLGENYQSFMGSYNCRRTWACNCQDKKRSFLKSFLKIFRKIM